MPSDRTTGHEGRAGAGRASHAGACARAGLFTVLGTVLATFGHHAVAEGTVPWRLVAVLIVAQFSAVWPLARRRCAPVATVVVTLAMQGMLHLLLSSVDGDTSMVVPRHATHSGHLAGATGDGHSWHHAGAAMTTVHAAAALAVAWMLHRADARVTAALGTLRTLARAAAAALAQMLPRAASDAGRVLPRPPRRRMGGFFGVAAGAREQALEHAVVRRGPPRRERPPVLPWSRCPRGRTVPFHQGVPLCPSPLVRRRVPDGVSPSPVPSR
ncbi:hypothetical protein [Streptomyces sp. Amel2xC10]|uniref:hypothetical protein n=1 Tax=Streptomyces sp. Amel2xC10 TaxID=1305826 RepID=UPI0015C4146F|nr:hypothetical protein [Streptomyces sp. Amel2xC10]